MRGRVASFDEAAGLGVVEGADGHAYPFHCTAVSDGTRTIPVGVAVRFDVVAGHLGRWEAASIERL